MPQKAKRLRTQPLRSTLPLVAYRNFFKGLLGLRLGSGGLQSSGLRAFNMGFKGFRVP